MIPQVPGKIYLADQRGVVASSQFRRQSTFSFGDYQQVHKEPFGLLYGLNEETLVGGHAVELRVAQDSYIVLLPITGTLAFDTGGGASGTVEVEQLLTLAAPAGTLLRLRNPYKTELISFLHLWVRAVGPLTPPAPAIGLTTVFDWTLLENQLRELVSFADIPAKRPVFTRPLPFALSLGCFLGRHEAVYQVQQPSNQLFAFVLAGAFELEGRLLHERDGVALWDVEQIELEALSNHALVLVLELAPEA